MTLTSPSLVGDTLFGSSEVGSRRAPVRIPVASVRTIERWRVLRVNSPSRTDQSSGDAIIIVATLVAAVVPVLSSWIRAGVL